MDFDVQGSRLIMIVVEVEARKNICSNSAGAQEIKIG
jgi:hypothetical protein